MYLWPLPFYLLSMSTSSRQSAQFCSSCFISYLPFPNCAANPASWSFSAEYPYSSPNQHLILSIAGFTNLSRFQNLHPYISLLFRAHLPTNCFSCHCSNSSHSNFLPPCLVQPVTILLRSIIMAYAGTLSLGQGA